MNTEQVNYSEYRSAKPFPKLREETTYCLQITQATLDQETQSLKFFAGAVGASGEATKYSAAAWLTDPRAANLQGKEKAKNRKMSFDSFYHFFRAAGIGNIPTRAKWDKTEKSYFINGEPVQTAAVDALDDTIAQAVFAALDGLYSTGVDGLVGKRFYGQVKADGTGKYRNVKLYTTTAEEPTDVEVEYTNLAE